MYMNTILVLNHSELFDVHGVFSVQIGQKQFWSANL